MNYFSPFVSYFNTKCAMNFNPSDCDISKGENKGQSVIWLKFAYEPAKMMLIEQLLRHNDLKTTQIYTHVSKASLSKVKSPLDILNK